tara:strand:- start:193 stop:684 length:492 start_codon:yes stop_codon:yes gene_type:complete
MQPHDTPYIASSISDAKAICSIYTFCFGATLGLASVRTMLSSKNNFAFLGSCDEGGSPGGFIFCRVIGNESELLWLGVIPSLRRRGGAQVLMVAAIEEARVRGSEAMLLEVAEPNEPALFLYKKFGFVTVGKRSRYYKVASGEKVDAKIMRLPLKSLMRAVRK